MEGYKMNLTVYLAGEIHTDWRDRLINAAESENLPLSFVSPQTNHERSDSIGKAILGKQPSPLYTDAAASDINNFRTKIMMEKADIVRPLFGEDYKQWNTLIDRIGAIRLDKPIISI